MLNSYSTNRVADRYGQVILAVINKAPAPSPRFVRLMLLRVPPRPFTLSTFLFAPAAPLRSFDFSPVCTRPTQQSHHHLKSPPRPSPPEHLIELRRGRPQKRRPICRATATIPEFPRALAKPSDFAGRKRGAFYMRETEAEVSRIAPPICAPDSA